MANVYAGKYSQAVFDGNSKLQKSRSFRVYTDEAATTLATLYTSRTKASTVTQPITTTSSGMAEFFADAGDYWIKVGNGTPGFARVYEDKEDTVDPAALASANSAVLASVELILSQRDQKEPPVRVAVIENVDLSAPGATLDGLTMISDDSVLLSGQTDGAENGLWDFNGASSAMTRRADANTSAKVTSNIAVWVAQGTYADTLWVLKTDDPIVLDETELVFDRNVFSSVREINGVEPDAGGVITLTPEDVGIELDEVTPQDIGAVADPGSGVSGQLVALNNGSTRTFQFIDAPSAGTLDSDALAEGLGLWGIKRRHAAVPRPISGGVLTTFQSGHNWVASGPNGSGSGVDDTSTFIVGTQSLRMDAAINASTLTYITSPTLSPTLDLTTDFIEILAYEPGTAAGALTGFTVDVSSDNGSSWKNMYTNSHHGVPTDTWSVFRLDRWGFNTTSLTGTAVNRIRIGARTATGASVPASYWIQSVTIRPSPAKGKVVFIMPSGLSGYNNFEPFRARGIVPSIGITPEQNDSGASSYLTTAKLKELYINYGVDPIPYMYSSSDRDTNITTNLELMESSVLKSLHWMHKEGFSEPHFWLANSTGTNFGDPLIQPIAKRYFNAAMGKSTSSNDTVDCYPPHNPHALNARQNTGSTPTTGLNTYLDRIAEAGGIGIIQLVSMNNTTSSGTAISQTDLATVLDYALGLSSTLDIVTANQLVEQW